MISVTFFRDQGRFSGFRATGHSGYDRAGRDIVCAAVSILGCTCVNSLESLLGIQVLVRENREGLLTFDLPALPADRTGGAELLMGALHQGLKDLSEAYPDYVTLEIKGRRNQR